MGGIIAPPVAEKRKDPLSCGSECVCSNLLSLLRTTHFKAAPPIHRPNDPAASPTSNDARQSIVPLSKDPQDRCGMCAPCPVFPSGPGRSPPVSADVAQPRRESYRAESPTAKPKPVPRSVLPGSFDVLGPRAHEIPGKHPFSWLPSRAFRALKLLYFASSFASFSNRLRHPISRICGPPEPSKKAPWWVQIRSVPLSVGRSSIVTSATETRLPPISMVEEVNRRWLGRMS